MLSTSVKRSWRAASVSATKAQRPRSVAPFATRANPLPTVETCPSPTCGCAEMPPMPEGLDIDREGKLNGVITGYAEHVLVCTGQDDWMSKIEDEKSGDNLAADLKELFGRGGRFSDPFHNVSILNSSFPSSDFPRADVQSSSVYLLPSFKYVPFLPRVSFDSVEALAKGYLLPKKLHSAHDGLSPIHRDRLTRSEAHQSVLPGVRDVDEVLVLICGHGGRDMRCGVMGPVLRNEFEDKLDHLGYQVLKGPVQTSSNAFDRLEGQAADAKVAARVGLISHIGGHKFAGNVIIYLPPHLRQNGKPHPLAGHGIWYGRVEPRHVEGVIRETVDGGRIIKDMFRGGIDANRHILRL